MMLFCSVANSKETGYETKIYNKLISKIKKTLVVKRNGNVYEIILNNGIAVEKTQVEVGGVACNSKCFRWVGVEFVGLEDSYIYINLEEQKANVLKKMLVEADKNTKKKEEMDRIKRFLNSF